MRPSRRFASSLAAATIALFTSTHNSDAAKLEGRSVKIGCLASLTGKGAEWGQGAKISMEIAVEEINAKGGIGGIPIELICYDTQTLEAEALKAVSRLVERYKVLAIQGRLSVASSRRSLRSSIRMKTVINSYCSAKPGLSAMSKWAFRNTLTSDKQLKPVVDAWIKEYKIKKVVIIYDAEDAVSKGEGAGVLPALFKAHGVEVLEFVDLSHQGHRLLGASHQGKNRWAPRASASAPATRTPAPLPRKCRNRGSMSRSSAALAPARRASSRSPAKPRKALTCRRRPCSTIEGLKRRPT